MSFNNVNLQKQINRGSFQSNEDLDKKQFRNYLHQKQKDQMVPNTKQINIMKQQKLIEHIRNNTLKTMVNQQNIDRLEQVQKEQHEDVNYNLIPNCWEVNNNFYQETKSQSWIPAQNYTMQFVYEEDNFNTSKYKRPKVTINRENLRKHLIGNVSNWNKNQMTKFNTQKEKKKNWRDDHIKKVEEFQKSVDKIQQISEYLAKPQTPIYKLKKNMEFNQQSEETIQQINQLQPHTPFASMTSQFQSSNFRWNTISPKALTNPNSKPPTSPFFFGSNNQQHKSRQKNLSHTNLTSFKIKVESRAQTSQLSTKMPQIVIQDTNNQNNDYFGANSTDILKTQSVTQIGFRQKGGRLINTHAYDMHKRSNSDQIDFFTQQTNQTDTLFTNPDNNTFLKPQLTIDSVQTLQTQSRSSKLLRPSLLVDRSTIMSNNQNTNQALERQSMNILKQTNNLQTIFMHLNKKPHNDFFTKQIERKRNTQARISFSKDLNVQIEESSSINSIISPQKQQQKQSYEPSLHFQQNIEEFTNQILVNLYQNKDCQLILDNFLQFEKGQMKIQLNVFFQEFFMRKGDQNIVVKMQKRDSGHFKVPKLITDTIRDFLEGALGQTENSHTVQQELYEKLEDLRPTNLLEEIGGYKQISRIMLKFMEDFEEQELEKEIQISIGYIKQNFEDIAKSISSYLKDPKDILEFDDTKIEDWNIQINNLDFFIIKLLIWKIFMQISVPYVYIRILYHLKPQFIKNSQQISNITYDSQMKIIQKLEKLRYKITQDGKSLDISNSNNEVVNHMIIGLKSSTIKGNFKQVTQAHMTKMSHTVINYLLGYNDQQQFLEQLQFNMKKRINLEFLINFKNICMDFLDIYCQNHAQLMRDFIVKCDKLESWLDFKKPLNHYIKDIPKFLENLLKWIEREQVVNPLETELLRQDVEKIDILEFFFYFYLSNYNVFSFNDFALARPFFSTSDALLTFWLLGIKCVLFMYYDFIPEEKIYDIINELAHCFFYDINTVQSKQQLELQKIFTEKFVNTHK